MDVLRPGYSLVDSIEERVMQTFQASLGGSSIPDDYDNDLLLKRIDDGKLLRIGLTMKEELKLQNVTPQQRKTKAYAYVDQYRDLRDVVSACMLSSYIPTLTGPLKPSSDSAVGRAWIHIKEMEAYGFIKHGSTQRPIMKEMASPSEEDDLDKDEDIRYIDGGLSNMWPEIDEHTIIVTPMNGSFSNPAINPAEATSSKDSDPFIKIPSQFQMTDTASIGLNTENLASMREMAFSSDDKVLEARFRDGYDDAK